MSEFLRTLSPTGSSSLAEEEDVPLNVVTQRAVAGRAVIPRAWMHPVARTSMAITTQVVRGEQPLQVVQQATTRITLASMCIALISTMVCWVLEAHRASSKEHSPMERVEEAVIMVEEAASELAEVGVRVTPVSRL